MPGLGGSGRIVGLDTARGVAIFGMIATHIYPLLTGTGAGAVTPTWVGMTFTGVSSALFVVLAGVGLSLLTRNTAHPGRSRVQLSMRALILIFIGLLLGHAGSNVAIILVHYGVLFLVAMWFITMSRKVLTITAISWIVVAPWVHGLFTRFMHVQAGGTSVYVENWRLWTSPTLLDVLTQPLLTLWDVLFTGYYPVISFLGYILVGMAIGRANLRRLVTAAGLFVTGAVIYVASRGLGAWFLSDDAFAYRVAHATGYDVAELDALAATGAQIDTNLIMGAPQWFGLAVPHSGAPLDMYSTAGAALAAIGLFLMLTRSTVMQVVLLPITATGMIALTAYTAHVILTGLWPRTWPSMVVIGDPVWDDIWLMLIVHWVLVAVLGMVVYFLKVRGPLESLLRNASRVTAKT
ncbi:heparan-alpha-glucosaminide N-acetyltransferase domain-containing protein [Enteractinococcus fodinae]|uniref:Membrane protein YeiB n=1 Tax=Enteractinococcus fodinae TaxID=684663 RepID=A0ABU2B1D6_9MICC|nr:heparan-alpha-glucosaminide N-acetyltransferase domain-containing protein [Enteractinococcus fodinae]MDR7347414.1 putative membrane protein YeiB [Enteractinococcus fodinae]